MHLVHYINSLNRQMGGTVTAVLDVTVSLRELGHDITVLTHEIGVEETGILQANGIRLVRSGTPRLNGLFRPSDVLALRHILGEVDVLHLHGIWSPGAAQLGREAESFHLPFVITTHGMLSDWAMTQKPLKKRLYWAFVLRHVLHQASCVHVTASQERYEAAQWIGNNRVECLAWVFRPAAYTEASQGVLKTLLPSVPVERPLLLFLSRLHPKKGLHNLIEALAQLKTRRIGVHLVVAGEWESARYESSVRAAIRNAGLESYVTFVGFVSGANKMSLLRHADLLVLPTSQENFGFVSYEALSVGTPAAITTGIDTWRELEASGGAKVVPREPGGLAHCIADMVYDLVALAEMGARGRGWIEDQFANDAAVRRFESLYLALASPRSTVPKRCRRRKC